MTSHEPGVEPKGACVGSRGSRVRMVVNELRGEKVDIVPFSEEPSEFVMKALSPARVKEVRIDEGTGTAEVIVPDYQLSLAIGKEGQNARLAARLTGCRIDIRSDAQTEHDAASPSPGMRRPPQRSGATAPSSEGRPPAHRPPPLRAEHPGPATR